MFKAMKSGLAKMIPGHSGKQRQRSSASRHPMRAAKNRKASSFPSSYLDSDSLFK